MENANRNVSMYQLHYFPANANAAPHMLLEALGAAIFPQDQSAGDMQ